MKLLILLAVCSLTVFAKPNIVVIIADDLGYADMAFLPQAPADVKRLGTPGFDELAATGTYFENAYGASPICSPSRAGLITGRYQQRWGNYWYGEGGLPLAEQTIPEALKAAGYVTAKYGKTHLNGGPKQFPTLHGFDEYLGFVNHTWDYIRLDEKDVAAYKQRKDWPGSFGKCQVLGPLTRATKAGQTAAEATPVSYENGFTTKIFSDEAVNFIERERGDTPFYLHVSHNAVHMPTYIVDKIWAEKTGARYVPWDRKAKRWGYPYWEPNEEHHTVFHKKWGHMGEIDREGRRCYLANLLALDDGILRILMALEKIGQRENTLVFFVSDNGGTINTYANNTPLNGWKYMFGEGGIRIPYLVSLPGRFPEGEVNKTALVSTMDIMPTALEIAGIDRPDKLDGKSLVPVLEGKTKDHQPFLAWAKNRNSWVLRKGKWKLTENVAWTHRDFQLNEAGDVLAKEPDYQYPDGSCLFDLEADIGETTNLIETHPQIAAELRALYQSWDAQMPGPMTSAGKPKKPRKKK